jgi:hypothetical protein
MVDFGSRLHAKFLENPLDLFLFAPHYVPVVAFSLLPLSIGESFVDAIAEGGSEFDVLADYCLFYGGLG